MPKKYIAQERERAVRLVREQTPEFGSVTATAGAAATRLGMSWETIRNWYKQDDIDDSEAAGVTSEERTEIRELKAKVRRLEEDNAILKASATSSRGTRRPQALIVAFIDEMRAQGFAVESVCRVLSEQGCHVTARTYRGAGGHEPRGGGVGARLPGHAAQVDGALTLPCRSRAARMGA